MCISVCEYECTATAMCDHLKKFSIRCFAFFKQKKNLVFQTVLAFSTFQSLVEKPITLEIGPDYNANSKRDIYFYCPLEFNGLAGWLAFRLFVWRSILFTLKCFTYANIHFKTVNLYLLKSHFGKQLADWSNTNNDCVD